MPTVKTVKSWNFKCLGFEEDDGEVKIIWCEICRDFYQNNNMPSNTKSFIKGQVQKFVDGTKVIKRTTFLIT